MSFRTPAISFLHEAQLSTSSLASSPAADTGFPLGRIRDGRIGSTFRFNASGTNQTITVDRGAGTLASINRIAFGPSANSLDPVTGIVEDSPDDSVYTQRATFSMVPGAWEVRSFSVASTQRYVKITFQTTAQHELTELILTEKRQLAEWGDPDWEVTPLYPAERIDTGSRSVGVIQGPPRRRWGFTHRATEVGSDYDVYKELVDATHGGMLQFLFDPPDTIDGQSVWVSIEERSLKRSQDHPAPAATAPTYTWSMILLEVTA